MFSKIVRILTAPMLQRLFGLFFVLSTLLCLFPLNVLISWSLLPSKHFSVHEIAFDFSQHPPTAQIWLLPSDSLMRAQSKLTSHPNWPAGPHLIPKGKVYEVSLSFKLPESNHNIGIGMFQVTTEAMAVDGTILHSTSKPCSLYWRSFPIRAARLVIFSLPYLSGFWHEYQTVHLSAMQATEGKWPLAGFRVNLQPRASISPLIGIPHLYSAHLIVKQLSSGSLLSRLGLEHIVSVFKNALLLTLLQGTVMLVPLCLCLRMFKERNQGDSDEAGRSSIQFSEISLTREEDSDLSAVSLPEVSRTGWISSSEMRRSLSTPMCVNSGGSSNIVKKVAGRDSRSSSMDQEKEVSHCIQGDEVQLETQSGSSEESSLIQGSSTFKKDV